MIILDATIVNVALESIQHSLHFSPANLAWVVNAYILTFGGFLLLAGRLGDLIGRKTMFLFGIALFTLASLACGLATNQLILIVARAIQGIGGATIASIALAMIYSLFSQPSDQRKAMSIFSFVSAAGGSIGLITGGVLTQLLNWHWIFLVNLPIGIFIFIAGFSLLDGQKALGIKKGVDVLGAVLITAASMILVYTIIQSNETGLQSMQTLGLSLAALVLIGSFIFTESRIHNPLVPLRIFRVRNLVGAGGIFALFVSGLYGWFFLSALYFERVLGYNSLRTGLAFLPATIVIAIFSLGITNQIIKRFGLKPTVIIGLIFAAASLALFTLIPLKANFVFNLLPGMILFGIGGGITFIPLMTMAMSEASENDSGLASGLLNTSQQLGAALGLAILASFAATRTAHLLTQGQSLPQALVGGYQLAFVIGTIFVIGALVVAMFVLRSKE